MSTSVHIPRKRFGQHFLHDRFIIAQIIAAIAPQPNQHLVEIGPGLGALTQPILALAGSLDAVELDRDVIPKLQQRCQNLGQLTVHQADALRFDFAALAKAGERLRIFGNLPYNISTPLLFHLLQQRAVIQDMHFMLQKEVVDRLTAQPGTAHYGRLSIMAQYWCTPMALFDVPPEAFTPPPKVCSSVVCLLPHQQLPITAKDFAMFAKIVATVFTQRRKTLRNALKSLASNEQLQQLGALAALRPEQLSISDYVAVSDVLSI